MSIPVPFGTSLNVEDASWEPFEVGQVQWLRRPGEGDRPALSSGFTRVTPAEAPETIELTIHADETLLILEGHVRVEVVGGEVLELTAGTSATFNKGTLTRWTILEPTVEFFVYS